MTATEPILTVNPDRCLGCRTCEIACATAHSRAGSLIGAMIAGEALIPRNRVVAIGSAHFPTQCRQCEDAPCVKVCPTGATYRTDIYTAVNPNLCIACKMCMMVCPFGAIRTGQVALDTRTRRIAIKCDLCVDRAGDPACVESCPTGAITLEQSHDIVETALQASAERFLEAIQTKVNVK